MIVFGKNKYKLKVIKPKEWGIPLDDTDRIVVYQRYAHIYFIPLFSLGKVWAIKRGDALFDLPEELKAYLQHAGVKIPRGWLAFAWFWLLLIGFIGYQIYIPLEERRTEQAMIRFHKEQNTERLAGIDTLSTDHIMMLRSKAQPAQAWIVEVQKAKGDSVVLSLSKLTDIDEIKYSTERKIIQKAEDDTQKLTLETTRAQVRQWVCTDPDMEGTCTGATIPGQGSDTWYIYRFFSVADYF